MMSEKTRLYNLLHTGNPGDDAYYRACCHSGESVLEVGCGNGRITEALWARGCLVQGIDNDAEMIAAFDTRMASMAPRPVAHLADMRRFALPDTFGKIIVPFNGLLCLLTEGDVRQALSCMATHLAHGGELIFDMYYVPEDFANEGEEEEAYVDTTVLDDNGTRIDVYEKTLVGDDPQRFDTSYVFVTNQHCSNERQFEMTVPQRCIYMSQIPELLQSAGLRLEKVTSDFTTDSVITDDTAQITVHARSLLRE